MNHPYDISIVTPVHNEAEAVEDFCSDLVKTLNESRLNYEIIFVDDGSRDNSYEVLKGCQARYPGRVKLVRLGRNFGHQLAITAGMRLARGRSAVIMDSDGQDPPTVILDFIEYWQQGFDIVYGVRTERKGETLFKKFTASLFYKLLRLSTNIDIPENVGDFYLLDRKVLDILNAMDERHRFMRGLVAWVGFKRKGVGYVRQARQKGQTKFGFWKMLKFSFDAATTFSFAPLRAISLLGFIISLFSFLGILLIIFLKLFTHYTITGWSSLMVGVLFIGGIQLLAIGIIGEYIARIGDDVKQRPLYTVKEFLE